MSRGCAEWVGIGNWSSWNDGLLLRLDAHCCRRRRQCQASPMKEDVLEQIVDDYLQMQEYFTTHNVLFNPLKDEHYVTRDDSVPRYARCRRRSGLRAWPGSP
jgi:hypothetical protein